MNPQHPTREQLKQWNADDAQIERIKQAEAEQSDYDQRERDAYLLFQEYIKDGNGTAAVEVALDMDGEFEDKRKDCPVFQMVKWLKQDGFFEAEIEPLKWKFIDNDLTCKVEYGHFYMKPYYNKVNGAFERNYIVLNFCGATVAFDCNEDEFTPTLQRMITARHRFWLELNLF